MNSVCANKEGFYLCDCLPGFYTNGNTCDGKSHMKITFIKKHFSPDIDECCSHLHECNPWADCINTAGSYECVCQEGFIGDGKVCESNQIQKHFESEIIYVFIAKKDILFKLTLFIL